MILRDRMEMRRDRVINRTTIPANELGGKESLDKELENESVNEIKNNEKIMNNTNNIMNNTNNIMNNTNNNTINTNKHCEFKYMKLANGKLIKLNRKTLPRLKTKLFTISLVESLIKVTYLIM